MPDHIHMLVDIPTSISVANFVKKIKQESSFLMAQNPNFPKWNGWEEGYGAFTYSVAEIPTVKAYIKNQKEHHRKTWFFPPTKINCYIIYDIAHQKKTTYNIYHCIFLI